MINRRGPYRFLIDTGADGMGITPQVAREARIPASRWFVARISGHGGQPQRAPMVTLDRIESPGLLLQGVGGTILNPEIVARLPASQDKINGGIIGLGAFRDALLEIDFPRRTVSLRRLGSVTNPVAAGLPYTGTIPHVVIATPSATRPTATVLIDTGTGVGFLFTDIESYPTRSGLINADEYYSGIAGYWRPRFGQLAGDIRLGAIIWRDAWIGSAEKNTLGSAALAPWKLVIDQRKKMLWLLGEETVVTTRWPGPLDHDGRPAVYGFVAVPDGDEMVIKEVDAGSRAERAGLKVGDRYRWEVPRGAMGGHAPFHVTLHVTRGAEHFDVTLSLLDSLRGIAPALPLPREGKPAGD
ncbi:MAG TPA: aspartyl protease family protein [Lacunisphaera sp.]|nr:aspartyl protease family protein [Lacunisphaera sp.]